MERNLVIGASGQIGEHCLAALRAAGSEAIGTYCRHARPGLVPLDVADAAALDRLVAESAPRAIYFAAAMANVDYCETHPDAAWQINVAAVNSAVDVANRHGCKLVFLSSEYIFDGAAGPYGESTPANPLQVYGRQKLIAEHAIALFAADWLIIRTAGVYSWELQGKNFICRLVRTLGEGKRLTVPADQVSTPTYAPDLARAMVELAARNEQGVFNVSGPRLASRYELALAAARAFELDPALIAPVSTAALGQDARRPLKGGLIVEKAERTLGRPLLDFEEGLRAMRAQWQR